MTSLHWSSSSEIIKLYKTHKKVWASSFVFQTNFTEVSPRREKAALVDFRKIKQRDDVQDTHSDIKGDIEATGDIET